jgi:hypothetical protein
LLPGIGNLFEGVEEIRRRVATEFGSRLNDESEREQHAPDAHARPELGTPNREASVFHDGPRLSSRTTATGSLSRA